MLHWRQLQPVEPLRERADREVAHRGDVAAVDLHLQGFRLQLRAVTGGAFLRGLVLPQEDADVLLVALLLEVAQEGKDALVPADAAVQELLALRCSELLPGDVHRDPLLLRELGEGTTLVLVARLRPRVDRAVAQGAVGVGDDQRLVVFQDGPESIALRAGTAGRVEREELRRRRRHRGAVVRALEALGEMQARDALSVERRGDGFGEQHHRVTIPLAEGRRQRVGEAAARFVADDQPVDDDEQLFRERHVDGLGEQLVEVLDDTVDAHAHEALCPQVLDDHLVGHLVRALHRRGDVEAGPGREGEHGVGHGLHGVGLELAPADGADRVADARPEQPQVVVDLGGGADGGARRLGGVLLLDRHGRGEPVDEIDVRLLHALEELACVGAQRLDVPPLALGVDGVERERRLARPRRPRDDGERPPRDLQIEPLQIVLPRAADDQLVLHQQPENR